MNYKICTRCEKEFEATTEFFHKQKGGKFGLRSVCKICCQKYIKDYNKNYKKNNITYAKVIFSRTKQNSKRKNVNFNLTLGWIQKRLDAGICEVTGIKFDCSDRDKRYTRNPFIPSVDRVDSTKGYIKDNCKLVIWAFNSGKAEYSMETTYEWCKAFVKQFEEI